MALSEDENLNKHYLEFDIIKGIMIISVILIHSLMVFYAKIPGSSHYKFLFVTLPIISINIAVPVFLIVMGRNYGASFKRKRYDSLRTIYSKDYFKKQIQRTVYPLLIISILSIAIGILLKGHLYFGIETLIGRMPFEGLSPEGWGNYFVSMIIQFIFIFPLLYIIYRKYPNLMLIMAFLVNLCFELLAANWAIFYSNPYIYRACILRCLFVIALGLWIMDKLGTIPLKRLFFKYKFILLGLSMSTVLIIENAVKGTALSCFLPEWQGQNLLLAFYPFMATILLYHFLPSETKNKFVNFISTLGKASYHIFLVQILFFASGYTGAILIIKSKLYSILSIYALIAAIIVDVIVCITFGLIFYQLESNKNITLKMELKKITH